MYLLLHNKIGICLLVAVLQVAVMMDMGNLAQHSCWFCLHFSWTFMPCGNTWVEFSCCYKSLKKNCTMWFDIGAKKLINVCAKGTEKAAGVNLIWVKQLFLVWRITTVLFLCFMESVRGAILWVNEGMLHFILEPCAKTFPITSQAMQLKAGKIEKSCGLDGWCGQFSCHTELLLRRCVIVLIARFFL